MKPPRYETFVDVVASRARHDPDRLAVAFLGEEGDIAELTYAGLERRVRGLAVGLGDSCRPGDRVLLLCPPGDDFVVSFLACLYAGVIPVPVYPPEPGRVARTLPRLLSIREDCSATAVLAPALMRDFVATALPADALRWLLIEEVQREAPSSWAPAAVTPDSVAFIQYTSGSTSAPKGVVLTHRNLLANVGVVNRGYEHTPQSRAVIWLPPYHDMGLIGGILVPLVGCFPTLLMSPLTFLRKPVSWLQAVTRFRATTSGGPNFAYDLVARKATPEDRAALDLSSWEVAFCGAEPIRADMIERFVAAFAPCGFHPEAFYPCYGLAEATLMVTGIRKGAGVAVRRLDRSALARGEARECAAAPGGAPDSTRLAVGCGHAIEPNEVMIVDPQTHRRCEAGRIGEIWVGGPCVASGYWNQHAATEEVFGARLYKEGARRFLRTGDLGFFLDDQLYVAGRIKDTMVFRGRNYHPHDIEQTVETCHELLRPGGGAAFSIEEADQERLVVVHEISAAAGADVQAVLAAIRNAISAEHQLRVHAIVLIEPRTLAKTSSGKVQRSLCRTQFLGGQLAAVAVWRGAIGEASEGEEPARRAETPPPENGRARPEIARWLRGRLGQLFGVPADEIDAEKSLHDYGLDSAEAIAVSAELEEWLGRPVPPTVFYEQGTIDGVAAQLCGALPLLPTVTTAKRVGARPGEAIAVVGIGCRFPGAASPEELWQRLVNAEVMIGRVPAERWREREGAEPEWGGFLDHVDRWDAAFFGISPSEARWIDPQQRLLLEVAWETLEHAGIDPQDLAGSRTGVFIGISNSDYQSLLDPFDHVTIEAHVGTGNAHSIAANRVSHFLDLRGPSLAVDTACSSSLVAVHLALRCIASGECDAALAGGVNLILVPGVSTAFAKAGMLARDGRCRTFDADAGGYVRGEGCGLVLLKPLSTALRDHDRIIGVIRASAVNQDGRTPGLTVPRGAAQESVISEALQAADVSPAEVTYVETHGTGTLLGDPIEVSALERVLGRDPETAAPCYLTSIKANIGHLESAAGIAGLIKVLLALEHETVPRQALFQRLNPQIRLERGLRIPTSSVPWPRGGRRIAGVSSFGFGGTNAHLIVEEPPDRPALPASARAVHLLPIAARDDAGREALTQAYEQRLQALADAQIEPLCYTAGAGRKHFPWRAAIIGRDRDELLAGLQRVVARTPHAQVRIGQAERQAPRVAFLFPGQGAEHLGMGRQLYAESPLFRALLQRCGGVMHARLGVALEDVLFAADGATRFDDTAVLQPALFAVEWALAGLWQEWGVRPDVLIGHSLGEYTAACVAGVFAFEEGLALTCERGRLMQRTRGTGAMATVFAPLPHVLEALQHGTGSVTVAAFNGPDNVVISGERQALAGVLARLEAQGLRHKSVSAAYAFHSPLMRDVLGEFEAFASQFTFKPPAVPLISNVTGQLFAPGEIPDAAYWRRQIRDPVQFQAGVRTVLGTGVRVGVEVGPGKTLGQLARACSDADPAIWLPSLLPQRDEWLTLLTSVATLYTQGLDVCWRQVDQPTQDRITAPSYPFARKRHWLPLAEGARARPLPALSHAASAERDGRVLRLRRLDSPLPVDQFEIEVTADAGGFGDHRVNGRVVFPAAGYVVFAEEAARAVFSNGTPHCAAVELALPLAVTGNVRMQVLIRTDPVDGGSFEIVSRDDRGWTRHAIGRLGTAAASGDADTLQSARARCPTPRDVRQYYRALEDVGLSYGPAFQAIAEIFAGDGEALARLELPPPQPERPPCELTRRTVILDAALQALGAAVAAEASQGERAPLIPLSIAQVQVRSPLPDVVWSHCTVRFDRSSDVMTADVALYDATGASAGNISGVQLRRSRTSEALPSAGGSGHEYAVVWERREFRNGRDGDARRPAAIPPAGTWLVFADAGGIGQQIARGLEEVGQRYRLVRPGAAVHVPADGVCEVPPPGWTEIEEVIGSIDAGAAGPVLGVVNCWPLDLLDLTEEDPKRLSARARHGVIPALGMARALARCRPAGHRRLMLVTRGARHVHVDDDVVPAMASLWGLGASIHLEVPALACVNIDLDPVLQDREADLIVDEVQRPAEERELAFRGGERFVSRLRPVHDTAGVTATTGASVVGDATYVVTGGLGELGGALAERLVARGARHLALLGRSAPGPAARERIGRLRAAGAEIRVLSCDVSDREALAQSLCDVRGSMPPIRGIVHAAGTVRDASILRLTPEAVEQAMRPKVQGAWNLHTLTGADPIEFFLLFSSIAAVLGSPGQSHYAAGNGFLDQLAFYRRRRGLPAVAVSWGPWAGTAMVERGSAREKLTASGLQAIDVAWGLTQCERWLQAQRDHVVIVRANWRRVREGVGPERSLLLEYLAELAAPAAGLVASLRGTSVANAADDGQNRLAAVLRWVETQIATVLELEVSEVDPEASLEELGMDSILLVKLRDRMEREFGVRLSVEDIVDGPTVRSVAELVLRKADGWTAVEPPPDAG